MKRSTVYVAMRRPPRLLDNPGPQDAPQRCGLTTAPRLIVHQHDVAVGQVTLRTNARSWRLPDDGADECASGVEVAMSAMALGGTAWPGRYTLSWKRAGRALAFKFAGLPKARPRTSTGLGVLLKLPRNVEYGTPAAAESSVRTAREPTADLAEQVVAVVGRHGDVAREGAQQAEVAVGVVVDRPGEVLDRDHLEEPGRLDLLAEIRQLARSRTLGTGRLTLANGV